MEQQQNSSLSASMSAAIQSALGLQCSRGSNNLTYAAILLAGPVAHISSQPDLEWMQSYYDYFYPTTEQLLGQSVAALFLPGTEQEIQLGEAGWQQANRDLQSHLAFMVQVQSLPSLARLVKEAALDEPSLVCVMRDIMALAVQMTTNRRAISSEQCDPEVLAALEPLDATAFVYRFFAWFNGFVRQLLEQERRLYPNPLLHSRLAPPASSLANNSFKSTTGSQSAVSRANSMGNANSAIRLSSAAAAGRSARRSIRRVTMRRFAESSSGQSSSWSDQTWSGQTWEQGFGQDQSALFSPTGAQRRRSMVWREMGPHIVHSQASKPEGYAMQNTLALTIPSDGLLCTGRHDGFSEWLEQASQLYHWGLERQSHMSHLAQTEILDQIEESQQLMVQLAYEHFVRRLCDQFHLDQAIEALHHAASVSSSLESSGLRSEHPYIVPILDRLQALAAFQALVMNRLQQVEQESQETHESLPRLLQSLYDQGQAQHASQGHEMVHVGQQCSGAQPSSAESSRWSGDESPGHATQSPSQNKLSAKTQQEYRQCWQSDIVQNQSTWKRFRTPHFVHDLEDDLQLDQPDAWQTF